MVMPASGSDLFPVACTRFLRISNANRPKTGTRIRNYFLKPGLSERNSAHHTTRLTFS